MLIYLKLSIGIEVFIMEKNVGKTDRGIRFILGLVFVYLGYSYHFLFYLVAAVLLGTSFMGTCLIYDFFKFNTLEKKK